MGGLRETAETYWHPEVEYVEDPRWPGASSYKGREAVLRCFQNYFDALGQDEDLSIRARRSPRSRGAAGVGDVTFKQSGRDCCFAWKATVSSGVRSAVACRAKQKQFHVRGSA